MEMDLAGTAVPGVSPLTFRSLPAPQPATLSRPRREGHGMAPRPPFPRAQAERGGAGRSPQPRLTRAPRWLQPRSQLASSGPEAGSRAGSSNYVARAGDRPQKYSAKKMKRQATKWDKILQTTYPNKRLWYLRNKEFSKLNSEKTNNRVQIWFPYHSFFNKKKQGILEK